jgi:hypothetical protein
VALLVLAEENPELKLIFLHHLTSSSSDPVNTNSTHLIDLRSLYFHVHHLTSSTFDLVNPKQGSDIGTQKAKGSLAKSET